MKKILTLLSFSLFFLACQAHAMVVRGTGTAALVGHDLTDPENDGQADANVGYNAVFRTSGNATFSGEGAFGVFDNNVGAGTYKWCCELGRVWVEADFGGRQYVLTNFTAASANDRPNRDSDHWMIEGSNDGVHYTTIFEYNNFGVSAWQSRLQVNQYGAGTDFATPAAYSIFRYESLSTVGVDTNTLVNDGHALGELEFFGVQAVPEPGSLALLALGAAGLLASRRERRA